MKNIIFLLSFLVTSFVAMSQCCVYIRAKDSIIMMHEGGTVEFVLRNKTKDSLGFLYNKGNGITEFRSIGATGGGTPGVPLNSVQFNRNGVFAGSDTMLFKNGVLNIHYNDSVGSQINYAWNQNPLNTWTRALATATIAYGTGYTMFTGTLGYNLNNFISYPRYVGVENYTLHFTQIITQKNNTSRGFMFNTPPSSGQGTGVSAYFDLSDTAGYITYNNTTALSDFSTTNKSKTQFIWSVGDIVDYTVEKIMRTFVFTMTNRRNGSQSKLTVNGVYPQVGLPTLYFFSEAKFIENFGVAYNVFYSPLLAGMGDSIFWGGNADTYDSKYFTILQGLLGINGVTIGAPAESSIQGTLRVADALAVNSEWLIYAYGVGDRNSGVSLDTFSARVVRTVQPYITSGKHVLFVNLVPQTSGSVVTYNDTLQAIATRFSSPLVDIYTLLKGAGTAMNPNFDYGDGVHPNTAGHAVIAAAIYNVIFPLIAYQPSPLIIQAPLESNITLNIARFTKDNHLVSVPDVPNSGFYILNQTVWDASIPQDATFKISGNGYIGGDFKAGAGSFVNPLLWVDNATSYVKAANFISRNFGTLANGSSIFNGANGGNYQQVLFTGGVSLSGYNDQAVIIKVMQANTIGRALDIDNTTAEVPTAAYHMINMYLSGNIKSWIDRGGGLRSDSTAGYNSNINGLITGHDWITKDYADSVYGGGTGLPPQTGHSGEFLTTDGSTASWAAVSGGSSLFPPTGTGTATGDVTGDLNGNNLLISNATSFTISNTSSFAINTTSGGIMNSDDGVISYSYLRVAPDHADILWSNNAETAVNLLTVNSDGLLVTLATGKTFVGGATDSVNYAPTSYVQKDWVLNHIANSGGGVTFQTIPNGPGSFTGNANKAVTVNSGETSAQYTTLASILTATATLNFGSTSASSSADLTVTVTGAAIGDGVSLPGIPSANSDANSTYTAWVSAANTITVRFNNYQSVGAIDPPSGSFKITVIHY